MDTRHWTVTMWGVTGIKLSVMVVKKNYAICFILCHKFKRLWVFFFTLCHKVTMFWGVFLVQCLWCMHVVYMCMVYVPVCAGARSECQVSSFAILKLVLLSKGLSSNLSSDSLASSLPLASALLLTNVWLWLVFYMGSENPNPVPYSCEVRNPPYHEMPPGHTSPFAIS